MKPREQNTMLRKIVENRGANSRSLSEMEMKISGVQDALKSLTSAVSVLKSIKSLEASLLFENLRSNFPKNGIVFERVVKQYKVNLITQALRVTKGNQSNAAKLLKLKPTTLNAIIKRHNISF